MSHSNTKIIEAILKRGVPCPQDLIYILFLKKLSISHIASQMGGTRTNVSNVVHGHYLSLPVAEQIAFETGIPLKKLWGDTYDDLIKKRAEKLHKSAA